MDDDFNTFILAKKTKVKRKTISLEQKLEVIKRYEKNERTCDIVRMTGLSEATLRCIRSNADKIKKSYAISTPSAAKTSIKIRPRLMEEMEKELVNWIKLQNSSISLLDIKSKALYIYEELKNYFPTESKLQFTASSGWFHRFKLRQRLQSIRVGSDLSDTACAKKEFVALSDTEQDLKPDILSFPESDVPQDISPDLRPQKASSNISSFPPRQVEQPKIQPPYVEENSCSSGTLKMASHFQNDVIANANEEVSDIHVVRTILLKNLGQIEESLDNLQTLDSRIPNSPFINRKVRHLLRPYYRLLEQKLAQLSDDSNMSNDTCADSDEYLPSFNLETVIHETNNNSDRKENQETFGAQITGEVVLPV